MMGDNIEDFLGNGGKLDDQRNVSLTWNTNRIPVFKSLEVGRPLYFVVNELRYANSNFKKNLEK